MSKLDWPNRACAAVLVCVATAIAARAQTLESLHSFDSTDGQYLLAKLVQATDGNLYGTTPQGGAYGYGTVFKITPSGTFTTLHSFDSSDGANPQAGLLQARDGNFYGTTYAGGADGYGTLFKITPSGTLTTLHSFDSTDGAYPFFGALVQGADGNFYGTTADGGASSACTGGCGTVFRVTPGGALTTLYSFDSTDGAGPLAALVQATDGNFYGTTAGGGASGACTGGCGTVYKITPNGTLTTLHSFDLTDGAEPFAELAQAADENFYGTTYAGGGASSTCTGGCGTVFKITPGGTLTTLHSFDWTDGGLPAGGLVRATDGSFYGTASLSGSPFFSGTLFKVTSVGVLTTLYNFCSQRACEDGSEPFAGLVQDTNGKFYGTTYSGGANEDGTVFSLSVGLRPFVETQPTSGKVGAAVKILGTNLTGATSVTFNGTAAVFKVISGSLISTTVPPGAATGKVEVVTSGYTLSSNVNFRVAP